LRGKIVDLIRSNGSNDVDEVGGISEVAIVEEEACPVRMQILVQMIHTTGVERRRTTNDAVHVITLRQQQLSEVRTV
jgi:hypothetical protein